MDGYKHYVRIDETGLIIKRFSDAFEKSLETDICVNENGDRHYNEPYINERGQYIANWVDNAEVARTGQELEDEWNARPPSSPTAEERIAELEAENLTNMLALVELHGLILSMGGGAE